MQNTNPNKHKHMKRKFFSLMALAAALSASAEVNYQVVPLPQRIELDKTGQTTLLIKGQAVSYPAENAQMRSLPASSWDLRLHPNSSPRRNPRSRRSNRLP